MVSCDRQLGSQISSLRPFSRALARPPGVWIDEDSPDEDAVKAVLADLIEELAKYEPNIPLDIIREISRRYINEFVIAGDLSLEGSGDSLYDFRLEIPREIRIKNQVLKAITIEYLLKSDITAGVFYKGHEILGRLFGALLASCEVERERNRYLLFPRGMRPQLREFADNQSDDWLVYEGEKAISEPFARRQEARAWARALLLKRGQGSIVVEAPSGRIQEKLAVRQTKNRPVVHAA